MSTPTVLVGYSKGTFFDLEKSSPFEEREDGDCRIMVHGKVTSRPIFTMNGIHNKCLLEISVCVPSLKRKILSLDVIDTSVNPQLATGAQIEVAQ